MRILGFDFTSRPTRRKPVTCACCRLEGDILAFEGIGTFDDLAGFEAALRRPGPWVAGFDFPFAHARRFVTAMEWPAVWPDYAAFLAGMTRAQYRAALEAYKAPRPPGDREHRRAFEGGTGAASPQKLYGVPVALMLFEGVPRLLAAGLHLPGLCPGDRARIGVEAYPGVAARALLGARRPYKSDGPAGDDPARAAARRAILVALGGEAGRARFGLAIDAPADLAEDPAGDALDALLCAVQAAWAFRRGHTRDGPPGADPLEGWIADPAVCP
ncbi:MAG: DUF429 domain-containing protein [Rhodobacteraceae bacterium]|nr:DUF429 domain-containing protein [Paracoccaceae bacterium]